jgi:hypothetical protein
METELFYEGYKLRFIDLNPDASKLSASDALTQVFLDDYDTYQKIHAGKANMFLSPLFRNTLAGVSGATIELYDTDGSVGAAKGAGIGVGIYKDNQEAFASLDKLEVITPDEKNCAAYEAAYAAWKETLKKNL